MFFIGLMVGVWFGIWAGSYFVFRNLGYSDKDFWTKTMKELRADRGKSSEM